MHISRLFFLTGLILLSSNSLAQNTENESVAKDTTITKPKLIPASEFTNELPDATLEIKTIQNSLIPDSVLQSEKIVLDTFLLQFEKFRESQANIDTNMAESTRLENLLYFWGEQKSNLTSIQNKFDKIKTNLLDQKESLDDIHNIWQMSMDASKEEEIPESTMELVNSFLTTISLIKDTINQKNEFVFTQLEKITNTNIIINESVLDIEAKIGKVTETLLLTKGPSIFKVISSKEDIKKTPENYSNSLKDIFTPISRYVSDNINKLIGYGIFFILLFVSLIVIKRKLDFDKFRKLDMRIIDGALAVLVRPIASSLLITLLIATFLIADAPHMFITFIFLLLVFPVMIILPAITIKQLNIYIYGLGFIYLLTLFLRISMFGSVTASLIMIAINLITLFGIIKFQQNKILSKILYRKYSFGLINGLFILFSLFLIVSTISIISGYTILGSFLLDSTIWSIYRFFLFYAAFVVSIGFLELLIRSDYMQQINSIKKNYTQILKWLNSLIYIIIITLLLYDILSIFNVEKPVVNFIVSIWEFELKVGMVHISFGNILTFFVTIWVATVLSKIISAIFEYDILKKFKLKRGVPRTISVMLKYAILTIGFLLAIAAAGMKLQSLTIVIGALGVGIGFGLQDVINNFISGLILLFERPIQIGDTIQVGELWGAVKQIGIRSSVIRTFSGSEVIVPNGMLISQQVTNWTLSDSKRRLDVEVGVAYGTELNRVIEILKKCANDHKEVMDDPAPSAWFTGFGDSSINFKLVFWYPSFEGGLTVKSQVALAVDNALKEANITIPFPQQDVYIKEIKDFVAEKTPIVKKAVTKKTPPKTSSSSTDK